MFSPAFFYSEKRVENVPSDFTYPSRAACGKLAYEETRIDRRGLAWAKG